MSTNFIKESWAELKKVQTPTKDETLKSTLGVFLMLLVFGVFLGVTDYVVGSLVRTILAID